MNRKETLILVLRSVIIHLRAWKVPPRIRSRRGCEMDKRYWWHMDSEWSITDPFQIIDNRVSFKWIIQGSQMDIRLCMNGMISFVRWMLQPTGHQYSWKVHYMSRFSLLLKYVTYINFKSCNKGFINNITRDLMNICGSLGGPCEMFPPWSTSCLHGVTPPR